MRILMVAGLAAVLAACSSEPPCDGLKGRTFLQHSRELSGTCGPVGDSLEVASGAPAKGCTSLGPIEATGTCAWGEARRCVNDDGSSVVGKVTYHLNDDDETWSGLGDITLRKADGSIDCHSVYEVTITPQ